MRNLKLSTKFMFGLGLIIVLAGLQGGLSVFTGEQVQTQNQILTGEYIPEVALCNELERNSLLTMYAMRGYAMSEKDEYREEGLANLAQVEEYLQKCDDLADRAEHLVKLKPAVQEIRDELDEYKTHTHEAIGYLAALKKTRAKLDSSAGEFVRSYEDYLQNQDRIAQNELQDTAADKQAVAERRWKLRMLTDVVSVGNGLRVACFKAQAVREPEIIEQAMPQFDTIHERIDAVLTKTVQDADIRELNQVKTSADAYKAAMQELLKNWRALQETQGELDMHASNILEKAKNTANAGIAGAEIMAEASDAKLETATVTTIFAVVVVLLVSVATGVLLARSITKPLKNIFRGLKRLSTQELEETGTEFRNIIEGLLAAAETTSSASSQVASTSQQMAEGSSEQAASLEETSASLEEISSVVRNNATNAQRAAEMARQNSSSTVEAKGQTGEALRYVQNGSKSVSSMSDAINQIQASSEETAKIIKTIDEIAFQTNLLALNAAVEAARAGEAGKGFAVVAEEVRNLAQRSAEAARNTAELIQQSSKNSESGVEASAEVQEVFQQIAQAIEKVSTNVAEITAASDEQTQLINGVASASDEQTRGIEQINVGVNEIDTVTQRNAANAEELAAAAEEMSGQTEELNGLVRKLQGLVDDNANATPGVTHVKAPARKLSYATDSKPKAAPKRESKPKPKPASKAEPAKKESAAVATSNGDEMSDAEKAIPFNDDDELENF
jgi:methyl-accepting chemotaxis protein